MFKESSFAIHALFMLFGTRFWRTFKPCELTKLAISPVPAVFVGSLFISANKGQLISMTAS